MISFGELHLYRIGFSFQFLRRTHVKLNVFYAKWTPRLLSVMRIVVAFLFMAYGAQKLFGFPAPMKGMPPLMSQAGTEGLKPLLSLIGVAAVLELVGGLFVLLGLFTRPVAFILAGEMAVAYFIQHAPGGFWPRLNGGEPAVLFCFVFLFLSVAGGGAWSLDRLIRRGVS
jgi:putative oxidoreductase